MRLTERKVCYPKSDKEGNLTKVDYIEIKDKGLAEEKLCQLEDIEDELGIDLITLLKAYKKGIYYKGCNHKIKDVEIFFTCNCIPRYFCECVVDGSGKTLYFKDCGKTWALTKEELS